MVYFGFHNHSDYCDGSSSLEDIVLEAIGQGMAYVGVSSHAPMKRDFYWTMPLEKFPRYVSELIKYKNRFADKIELFIGLEADYLPPHSFSFDFFRTQFSVDYIIGSVHLVSVGENFWFIDGEREAYVEGIKKFFQGDVEKAIKAYFERTIEMIESEKPDILGHMDKILMHNKNEFFAPNNPTFVKYCKEVLKKAKQYNVIVEINTRGLYSGKYHDYYPGKYCWEWIRAMDVPVMISVDAHRSDEILAGFLQATADLKNAGIYNVYLPIPHSPVKLTL
jgi:histidinol-phosphatase (PHP family)